MHNNNIKIFQAKKFSYSQAGGLISLKSVQIEKSLGRMILGKLKS